MRHRKRRKGTANSEGNAEAQLVCRRAVLVERLSLLGFRRAKHLRDLVPLMMLITAFRKLNTSPSTVDDKEALKKFLTNPPVKKIDLHFPLGLEVTARNLKGVTVKDALDAIHKQFKKKVSN